MEVDDKQGHKTQATRPTSPKTVKTKTKSQGPCQGQEGQQEQEQFRHPDANQNPSIAFPKKT
eukprot:scaffold23376_cov124-Isochrysis_galbana.AAC.2